MWGSLVIKRICEVYIYAYQVTCVWKQLCKMDKDLHNCLIIQILTFCCMVEADISSVHIGLHYQMQQCTGSSRSLQSGLVQHLACWKNSSYRCILFHEPRRLPQREIRLFCGVINTGGLFQSHTWIITVPSKFNIYTNFLHFYFPSNGWVELTNIKSSTHPLLKNF